MNNKICVVMVGYLKNTPPALSLIQSLVNHGYEVSVIVAGSDKENSDYLGYNFVDVNFFNVIGEYSSDISLMSKLTRLYQIRKKIWDCLENEYNKNSFVIVISEVTLKHLGTKIMTRNYIYYQLELIDEVYMIPGRKLFKTNVAEMARHAKDVIVCEYNRAHITKAWWKLDKLPSIVMNKPYVPNMNTDNIPDDVLSKINIIKQKANGRKIVIYQGIVSEQRPIKPFIDAVGLNPDKFFFVVVSNTVDNLDLPKDYSVQIPFIKPPYHMAITEIADIGVMVYKPSDTSIYSVLNPVYCAPNKIWEYARYGVPMVSNDLPSLKMEFLRKKMGCCVDELDPQLILNAYNEIIEKYELYRQEAVEFYNSYDVDFEISEIIRRNIC